MLGDRLDSFGDRATVWKNATAIGFYEDGVITVDHDGVYKKVKPKRVVVATGASEKFLLVSRITTFPAFTEPAPSRR